MTLNTTGSIQHKDTHISVLNRTDRTDYGIILQIFIHLVLLTDTGSIYQIEIKTKFIVTCIDGITCCAGNFRHNITIFTYKSIHDRRLTCIRTSHHCKAGNIFIQYFVSFFLECTNNQVHHITRSTTRHSRDTVRITQSQLIKFGSIVLQFSIIGLIGNQQYRLLSTAQNSSHLHIKVSYSIHYIYHKQNHVCFIHSHQYLFAYLFFENIVRVHHPSAGIYHGELLPQPFRFTILAVACCSCFFVHNRLTCFSQAVK